MFLPFFITINSLTFISTSTTRTIFPFVDRSENADCITSQGLQGKCSLITACPNYRSLLTLLLSSSSRPKICSWDRSTPIICCPLFNPRSGQSNSTEFGKNQSNSIDNLAIGCGRKSSPAPDLYIVGGEEVSSSLEWPWIAAIYRKQGNRLAHFCGGTIISDHFILTAAHCFNSIGQPNDLIVGVGSNNLDSTVKFTVQQIIIHDKYKKSKSYYDIALLVTHHPINFTDSIRPICLPKSNELINPDETLAGKIEIAGWGLESYRGHSGLKLRSASVEIISHSKCNQSYVKLNNPSVSEGINSDQLCAGSEEGDRDSCQGDSGGPLTIQSSDNQSNDAIYYQIGIISFGRQCAVKDYPGVYTKVSSYVNWIKRHLTPKSKRIVFAN